MYTDKNIHKTSEWNNKKFCLQLDLILTAKLDLPRYVFEKKEKKSEISQNI